MKVIEKEEQYDSTVQEIAKDTIEYLKTFIKEGITEKEIAEAAENYTKRKGVNSFWYHGVGAFVFVGKRTVLSISGKQYNPSRMAVKLEDLVTVDLSPEIKGVQGDFARTFVVSKGNVAGMEEKEIAGCHPEFIEGTRTEEKLHSEFRKTISEGMTLEEAYVKINSLIKKLGFENLDFKGNLGHSIERGPNKRIYIEAGNTEKFENIGLFTFEPHIKKKGGNFGFKCEDVYYFKDGELNIL